LAGDDTKLNTLNSLSISHSSCDETLSQLEMLIVLYPEMPEFLSLSDEYTILGKKINSYIEYVDNNWRT
jgi:four helix bundle protein